MTSGNIGRFRKQRLDGDGHGIRQHRVGRGRHLPAALLAHSKPATTTRTWASLLGGLVALFIGITAGLFGLGVAGAAGTYYYFTRDLPSLDDVRTASFETTKIYDRNWLLLHEVSDPKTGWRTRISLEEMSRWVIQGTIATEDASFYENPGIDLRGIVRAVYINVSGIGSSGGSTITMQLVRNVLPLEGAFEVNYTRKIKEAILALEFGRRYSKDEILGMYLNEVYYGNRAYGIEAAAQGYFNKLAKDLDLAEASLLVGLPQAPSVYDPTKNFAAARDRQRVVLDQMVKEGYLTDDEAAAAFQVDLLPRLRQPDSRVLKAPHFVNYVLGVLEQRYGAETVSRGGLVVQTTLDYETQVMAERVVKEHVETLRSRNGTNGSLVAIQPWSGQIIAMVGSADYYDTSIDGQVNVATRERQPGSAFKPISYAAAMMKGWSPNTIIIDSLVKYPSSGNQAQCENVAKTTDRCYIPENFDFKFNGPVTLRESLGRSLNIPAVKAIKYAGVAETINLAHDLGIKTGLWRGLEFYGLAITLGGGEVQPVEMAAAYATFANYGVHVPTTPFIKVFNGNDETYYEFNSKQLNGKQVLTPAVAYMLTDVLKDNKARSRTFGEAGVLNFRPRPAAVKTGSTTDNRDGWTVGYTTELAVAVWVGNSDNSATRQLDGVVAAGPIWNKFLTNVYGDPALQAHYAEHKTMAGPNGQAMPLDWRQPEDVVEGPVCQSSGRLAATGAGGSGKGLFSASMAPTQRCNELTKEEMEELQDGLQGLRRVPERFFPDGRSRLLQLSGGARIGAPRPIAPNPAPSNPQPPSRDPRPTATPRATPAAEKPEAQPSPTPAPAAPPPAAPTVAPPPATAQRVAVPNVVGLTEAAAQSRIRAAGLATAPPVFQRPSGRDTGTPGTVIASNPAAGTVLERGTVVTIIVRAPR